MVAEIKDAVDSLQTDVDDLKTSVASLETDVDSLQNDHDILQNDIESLHPLYWTVNENQKLDAMSAWRVAISYQYIIVAASSMLYVYELDNNGIWNQVQAIYYGFRSFVDAISISNDGYMVIGTEKEFQGKLGESYVYKRNDSDAQWYQIQTLIPSDATPGAGFGDAVSISNEYIVVGTFNTDRAYVYKRNETDGIWYEIQKLQASDTSVYSRFGTAISIANNYLVIGASQEDTGGVNSGAVYVFELNDTNGEWYEVAKLKASDHDPADRFGDTVSISNEYIIVSAWGEDTGGSLSGAAYIFERDDMNGEWHQVQLLKPPDVEAYMYFGESVSISNRYAVIGADGENYLDGAAYIYERNQYGLWTLVTRLKASGPSYRFGYQVSISNDYVAIIDAEYGWLYVYHGETRCDDECSSTENIVSAATSILGSTSLISNDLDQNSYELLWKQQEKHIYYLEWCLMVIGVVVLIIMFIMLMVYINVRKITRKDSEQYHMVSSDLSDIEE